MVTDVALELVAAQVDETPEVCVPGTGVLLDLTNPADVAEALRDVRAVKVQINEFVSFLSGVLRLESMRQGTGTLHLGSLDVVVSSDETTVYDLELLTELLRDAGLPEERIGEAVVETVSVSYKENRSVLRQLAGANPDYAAAIELAQRKVQKPISVTVKGANR